MRPVEIYTTPFCGFCVMAKRLLADKGVAYSEIDVSRDPALRQKMSDRASGHWTVPQIFVGDVHVGGCRELYALENAGRLDPLLAA